MQIKREDFITELLEEKRLRQLIRKGIKTISERKNEEQQLRRIIRKLITEAKAGELKVHDETGMNYLENLFSNTSFLTDLKGAYNSLTSNSEQRKSFSAHVLNAMKGLLRRDEMNRQEDDETEEMGPTSLKATPGVRGEPDIDLNVTDDEEEVKREEAKIESEGKFELLPGMDETGAQAAEVVWKSLSSLIQNELVKARDPRDRSILAKYLFENVTAYFTEWEKAMISKFGV